MNIDCSDSIECIQSDILQLSTSKPKPKPKRPRLKDALYTAFPDRTDAENCITWASQQRLLNAEYTEDGLQTILEGWKRRQKWSMLPTSFPTLEASPITVGILCEYLIKIIAIHPVVATIPVHHEECCGPCQTEEIEFDMEKGVLRFY